MTVTSPRVVIASRLFEPEVSAGAFRLGSLARGLVRRRAAPTVVTTRPPRGARDENHIPGVEIRRWPVLRDAGGNVRGYLQYASFDVPLFARLIWRRADAFVAESPPTTALVVCAVAFLRRRPLVYYAADVWTDGVIAMGASPMIVSVMRWMERVVLRRCSRVISVSDEVSERLIALGARPDQIVTVGNGIDVGVFTPAVMPAQVDRRYFVYTGTMSEWQRPEVFIQALAALPPQYSDVELRFFGQGAVEPNLRALAEQLVPGRVEFGGVVSPADSARWIRGAVAALVSIAPGIGYDFARPTKTYAAAACGTPVIFAGASTGGEVVVASQLGEAVGFDADLVAAAMTRMIAGLDDGSTERAREGRARWARENVSLDAVGTAAADGVLGALRGGPRGRD